MFAPCCTAFIDINMSGNLALLVTAAIWRCKGVRSLTNAICVTRSIAKISEFCSHICTEHLHTLEIRYLILLEKESRLADSLQKWTIHLQPLEKDCGNHI